MIEFDPTAATTKPTMVRYFRKSPKPSIKTEINQDAIFLDNYKELIAKAVKVEAKVGLKPSSYVQKTD